MQPDMRIDSPMLTIRQQTIGGQSESAYDCAKRYLLGDIQKFHPRIR